MHSSLHVPQFASRARRDLDKKLGSWSLRVVTWSCSLLLHNAALFCPALMVLECWSNRLSPTANFGVVHNNKEPRTREAGRPAGKFLHGYRNRPLLGGGQPVREEVKLEAWSARPPRVSLGEEG
jgi:hypothetical protein